MAEEIRKDIIISVKTDTTEAQQDVDNLKQKVSEVGDKAGGKGVQSFKNFKTQIREATVEAQKLEQQFGATDARTIAAIRNVAKLKDEYQEFGQRVNAFNPDNKLQALSQAGNAAVVALQGVTGALQLVGVEGEGSKAVVEKLQGALNFVQALGSVDDLKNGFKSLGAVLGLTRTARIADAAATTAQATATETLSVATRVATVSLRILKTALITTGIGALVVGLGFLIEKLFGAEEATNELASAQDRAKTIIDSYNAALKETNETLDFQTKLAVARARNAGATSAQIQKIELEGLQNQRLNVQKAISQVDDLYKNLSASQRQQIKDDLAEQEKALFRQIELKKEEVIGAEKQDRENAKKKQKQVKEDKKKEFEEEQAQIKDNETLFRENELARLGEREKILQEFRNKQADLQKKFDEKKITEGTFVSGTIALAQAEAIKLQEFDEEQRKKKEEQDKKDKEDALQREKEFNEAKLQAQKTAAENAEKIAKEEADFRNKAVSTTIDALGVLNGFLEQGTDLQKGVAIASVIVQNAKTIFDIISGTIKANTLIKTETAAVSAQLALIPFAGAGLAAANNARGAARITKNSILAGVQTAVVAGQAALAIRNISSANNRSTGGASGGGGGAPVAGASAPDTQFAAPIITASQTAPQNIQDVRVTNQTGAPLRAYIVDRDLQNQEQRTRFLNQLSNF